MRLRALEGLDGTKSPPSRWTSPQMPAAEVSAEATRLRDDYYGRIGTTSPEQFRQVNSGRQSLEEYGVSVPRSYQLYLALGRFRNALLLDEVARCPTPALEAFIYAHGLQGYRPAETSVTTRKGFRDSHIRPLFGCGALFSWLGASRVVAGAVGSPKFLSGERFNGDQTSDQEPRYTNPSAGGFSCAASCRPQVEAADGSRGSLRRVVV